MLKKIFKDSFIYAVLPQLPRVVSLLLLPILTKYLTSTDYGIFGLVTAYVAGFSALKDLGLSQVIVNAFYKEPENYLNIWKKLFGVLLIWKIIFCILLSFILYAVLYFNKVPNCNTIIFLVIFPILIFESNSFIAYFHFLLNRKSVTIGFNSLFTGIISLITNYVCVVYFKFGYMSFFIAAFIGAGISSVHYFFMFNIKYRFKPNFNFTKKWIQPYLKISLPTIPHNYSSYLLNTSDRLVLDVNKVPISQIGNYNFAYTFGSFFDIIGSAVGIAIAPYYLKLYSNKNENSEIILRKLTFALQMLFVFFTSICCLWLREIFKIIIANEELQKTYSIAIIIIMSYCYRPMYWAIINKLGFEEQTHIMWRITLVGGLINVILNILFVPFYGIWASSISTFIGLMYIGFSGFYFKNKHIPQNYKHMFWLLLIISISMFIFVVRDYYYVYKIVFSLVILIITIGMLIKIKVKELLTESIVDIVSTNQD